MVAVRLLSVNNGPWAIMHSGQTWIPFQEDTTRPTPLQAAIVALLGAMAVLTYIALTVDYFSWELELSRWLQGFSLSPANFLRGWLFWTGVREVASAVMVAVCLALWLRRWRLEALFVAIVFIPDGLNLLIKELVARPRPTPDMVDVVIGWGGIQGTSFPSGHALHAVLFYGFLLYLARRYIPNPALVRTAIVVGVAHILATGPWLIYDGRHWAVDVLGGYAYGAFYLLALIAGYNWVIERIMDGRQPRLLGLLHPRLRKAYAERAESE